jgi:sigma-B regulation protein RsbU (phosphoserine phosphatase)
MNNQPRTGFFDAASEDWQKRLDAVVETMREMSSETEPQKMVRQYAARMRSLLAMDRNISVSRRDLPPSQYRITRSSTWKEAVNPWKERDKLPLFSGGLLGELLYGDVPRVIDDCRVSADDPAAEYFEGMRSLVAIPQYDHGVSLNMVVMMRKEPNAFAKERVPELVWTANLFGRATQNLVLSDHRRHPAVAAARQAAQDPDAGPRRVLSNVAPRRRRLLRLLPAARRPLGPADCRRERTRHARGGHHGGDAQHRPRLSRRARPAGPITVICQ